MMPADRLAAVARVELIDRDGALIVTIPATYGGGSGIRFDASAADMARAATMRAFDRHGRLLDEGPTTGGLAVPDIAEVESLCATETGAELHIWCRLRDGRALLWRIDLAAQPGRMQSLSVVEGA